MRRILWLASAAILVLPATGRCQQQDQQAGQGTSQKSGQSTTIAQAAAPQQESLGDAARKAREQKKDAPKSATVFTNDDMPTVGGVSTVGAAATQGAQPAQGAAGTTPAGTSGNDEKGWRAKFANLRSKLAKDQTDLDLMQRELGVANVQNYTDPVKAVQQNLTREDLNKKVAAIGAKQKDIEADQKAISDAEDDLRKSGGDSGWAR